jgi:hypothetical protein
MARTGINVLMATACFLMKIPLIGVSLVGYHEVTKSVYVSFAIAALNIPYWA